MGSGDETSFKENISRSFMRLGFQISPFTSVLTQDYWAALMLCWSCDRVYAKFDWYFKVFFVVFFNCTLHIWPIPCNSNRSMSQRKTLNICTCIVLPCLNSQLFSHLTAIRLCKRALSSTPACSLPTRQKLLCSTLFQEPKVVKNKYKAVARRDIPRSTGHTEPSISGQTIRDHSSMEVNTSI